MTGAPSRQAPTPMQRATAGDFLSIPLAHRHHAATNLRELQRETTRQTGQGSCTHPTCSTRHAALDVQHSCVQLPCPACRVVSLRNSLRFVPRMGLCVKSTHVIMHPGGQCFAASCVLTDVMAHARWARHTKCGSYKPLASWKVAGDSLQGHIALPMQVCGVCVPCQPPPGSNKATRGLPALDLKWSWHCVYIAALKALLM